MIWGHLYLLSKMRKTQKVGENRNVGNVFLHIGLLGPLSIIECKLKVLEGFFP